MPVYETLDYAKFTVLRKIVPLHNFLNLNWENVFQQAFLPILIVTFLLSLYSFTNSGTRVKFSLG